MLTQTYASLSVVARPSYERVPSARLWFFVHSTKRSVESVFSVTLLAGGGTA